MIKIFSILFLAIGIFSDKRKRSKRVRNASKSTKDFYTYRCSRDTTPGKLCWFKNTRTGKFGSCQTDDCNPDGSSKLVKFPRDDYY
jgi:hypothetical protein